MKKITSTIVRLLATILISLFVFIPIVSAAWLASAHNVQVAASHPVTVVKKKMVKKKMVKKVVKKKTEKKVKKVKKVQKVKKKVMPSSGSEPTSPTSGTEAATPVIPVIPAATKTWPVLINNSTFQGGTLTIKKGDTVKFTNNDDVPHQVASNPHPIHINFTPLNGGILNKDGTFEVQFDTIGTFAYHCHLHPNMTGTITVTE